MKKNLKNSQILSHQSFLRNVLKFSSLFVFLLIGACAFGPSHFRRSYNVEKTFESFQLMTGHTYYHSGPLYNLDAIVAIKEGYTLNSTNWKKLDMDEQKLRRMVEQLKNTPNVVDNNPVEHGAYILNDQGEIIGAWYSMYILPILRFTSETEFSISQPMPIINPANTEGDAEIR